MAIFATNASSAIWWTNLQLMQVVPSTLQLVQLVSSAGQIYKWCHLMTKFETNENAAMWLLNLVLSHGVNFWLRSASGNDYLRLSIFYFKYFPAFCQLRGPSHGHSPSSCLAMVLHDSTTGYLEVSKGTGT